MRQAKGLTLIELLAVLFIIVLVATIVVPCHHEQMGGAPEAKCLANLDALRKSIAGYAGERDGKYPFATDDPTIKTYTHPSDGLRWFAREMGVQGKLFVCPATDDAPLLTDPDIGEATNDGYSYAYQAPFINSGVLEAGVNASTPNEVVFLGDKPPVNVGRVDWARLLSEGQTIEDLDEADPNR